MSSIRASSKNLPDTWPRCDMVRDHVLPFCLLREGFPLQPEALCHCRAGEQSRNCSTLDFIGASVAKELDEPDAIRSGMVASDCRTITRPGPYSLCRTKLHVGQRSRRESCSAMAGIRASS
jgi:hypothetical protein